MIVINDSIYCYGCAFNCTLTLLVVHCTFGCTYLFSFVYFTFVCIKSLSLLHYMFVCTFTLAYTTILNPVIFSKRSVTRFASSL